MRADWRDFDIDEIPEWPATAQHLVLLILMAVMVVVSMSVVVLPLVDDTERARQEEAGLRGVFRMKAEQVAALPDVSEQMDALAVFYRNLTRQLPAEEELALLLAGINDTGLQYDLNVEKLKWQSGHHVGWLYQVPLDIELTGDYDSMGQFSAALARLPRIVALQDFTLSREKGTSEQLRFSVAAHTYRYEQAVQP